MTDISRRGFLGGLLAVPLAAGLEARVPRADSLRVVVVGAGAFGSWTALHLLRSGATVELVDAWGAGNSRSSSGGETRVIRAAYGEDRIYSEMVKQSFDDWVELDAGVDDALYVETGALWLHRGDDSYFRSSLPILDALGFPVEKMDLSEAAKIYPQISFDGIESAWLERRAGALFARRSCMAILDRFVESGGTYRIARVATGTIQNGTLEGVRLENGDRLDADAYVFACGPWLGKLFPDLIGGSIRPTRQEVHYFGVPSGSELYGPPSMPVWIDFGERIWYGLPDLHGRGFKIADDTRGEDVDPTSLDRRPTDDGLRRARAQLTERFPGLVDAPLVEARVCQYENSPDGDLIVDRHPGATNVWIAGGGSGHGFKLSPAVGRMMADAIMTGRDLPGQFRISRLADESESLTQFD